MCVYMYVKVSLCACSGSSVEVREQHLVSQFCFSTGSSKGHTQVTRKETLTHWPISLALQFFLWYRLAFPPFRVYNLFLPDCIDLLSFPLNNPQYSLSNLSCFLYLSLVSQLQYFGMYSTFSFKASISLTYQMAHLSFTHAAPTDKL